MRALIAVACVIVACRPLAAEPPSPTDTARPEQQSSAPSIAATSTPATPVPSVHPPLTPQGAVVTFHAVDTVLRGETTPARRVVVNEPVYWLVPSPEPRYALAGLDYAFPALRLLDLDTGAVSRLELAIPPNTLSPMSATAFWLPDGRLVVKGHEVWIGGPRAEGLRSVYAQLPWEVSPSPSGKTLAITTLDKTDIVLLDLASGTRRSLAGPFQPCAQDGGIGLTWSPDERLIAATTCANWTQETMQARVLDIASGRVVRTFDGLTFAAFLEGGTVLAHGPFRPRENRRDTWVIAADGSRRALATLGGYVSPDGRYLVESVVRDAPTATDPGRRASFGVLLEIASGRRYEIGEGQPAGFTRSAQMVLVRDV